MAPLGVPVVPPVYCSTATSLKGSILTGAGLSEPVTTSASSTMRSRAGEVRGRARFLDLNRRNSVALTGGSKGANEHTMARASTFDCSSASTLSNSTLRSSVTMISVSLSLTCAESSLTV